MSKTVDDRVVVMEFDNVQFERETKKTMRTLEELRKSLDFDDSDKSLENLSKSISKVSFNPMTNGLDAVSRSFSALEVVSIRVLQKITDAALNAGTNLVKSLSVDNITAGFTKYEDLTGNVQTLVNATGKSVEQIDDYLQKLMWFSDETSYSFIQMTDALKTGVSVGGDMDKLIPMIMGIAEATAYAGKGANEFQRSIYNLMQSYGAGYLSLLDWRSVQQSGVQTEKLLNILIQTGEELGKIQKGSVTTGSFMDSLKNKWADKEVMEKAFGRFSIMMEDAYKLLQGNAEEAEEVMKRFNLTAADVEGIENASDAIDVLSGHYEDFVERATRSAQEAKSFSEAVAATQDAVSTGWMKTFQLIIGNYNEATELWTNVTDGLFELFAESASARNDLLTEWKYSDWGNRYELIEGFYAIGRSLLNVISGIKDGLSEVFPPLTLERLQQIVRTFSVLSHILEDQVNGNLDKFTRIARGGASIVNIFYTALKKVAYILGYAFGSVLNALDIDLLEFVATIGDAIFNFNEMFAAGTKFIKVAQVIGKILGTLTKAFVAFINSIDISGPIKFFEDGINALVEFIGGAFDRGIDGVQDFIDYINQLNGISLENVFNVVSAFFNMVVGKIFDFETITNNIKDFINSLPGWIQTIFNTITGTVKSAKDSITNSSDGILGALQGLWNWLKETAANIDPSTVFLFVIAVAVLKIMSTIKDSIDIIWGVSKRLNSLLTTLKSFVKALKYSTMMRTFTMLAVAMTTLAGAMVIMSQVPADRFNQVAIALTAFIVSFGTISALLAAFTPEKVMIKISGLATTLIALAGAIYILVKAFDAFNNIQTDSDFASKFAAFFVILATTMAGVGVYLNIIKGTETKLLGLAASILAFAFSIKIIGNALFELSETVGSVDTNKLLKTIGAIAAVMGILTIFMALTSGRSSVFKQLGGEVSKETGGKLDSTSTIRKTGSNVLNLIGAIASIKLLMIALKSVADFDIDSLYNNLKKHAGLWAGIAVAVAAIVFAVSKMSVASGSLGSALFGMTASILLAIAAVALIGKMKPETYMQGILGLMPVVAMLGVLFLAIRKTSEYAAQAGKFVALLAVGLGALTLVINVLGALDTGILMQGVLAISAVMLVLSGVFRSMKSLKGAKTSTLVMMSVIIAELCATLGILATIGDVSKILSATLGMSAVLLSLTAVFKVLQSSSLSIISTKSVATVTIMFGVVSAIMGILSAFVNPEGLITKIAALDILLASFIISMKLVSKVGATLETVNWQSLAYVSVMTGVLTGILALLSLIPGDSTSLLAKSAALSLLLLSFTGAMTILGAASPFIGMLGNIGPALAKAAVILGVVMLAFVGLGALASLLTDDMQNKIIGGINFIGEVLESVGAAVGKVISGLVEGALSFIPTVGQYLADFGTSIKEFSDNMGQVDPSVADVALKMVGVMAALGGAGVLNFLTGWAGKFSAETTKENLVSFAEAMVAFYDATKVVTDWSPLDGAVEAAGKLSDLEKKLPKHGGWKSTILGDSDLGTFAERLCTVNEDGTPGGFAGALVGFYNAVKEVTDWSPVTKAADAAGFLSTLEKNLPKHGGILQDWLGDNNLSVFGYRLGKMDENGGTGLAGGLISFYEAVKDVTDWKPVEDAANAAGFLQTLESNLPPVGGVVQTLLFGSNDLGNFGENIRVLGVGLYNFYLNTVGIHDTTAVDYAMTIIQKLVDIATLKDFKVSNISNLGSKLTDIAKNIKKMIEELNKVPEMTFDAFAMDSTISIISKFFSISTLVNGTGDLDSNWFRDFQIILGSLGAGLKTFVTNVNTIKVEDFDAKLGVIKKLIQTINIATYVDSEKLTSFATGILKIAKSLRELSKINENGSGYDNGFNYITQFIQGLQDAFTNQPLIDELNTSIDTMINNVLIKTGDSWYSYGDTMVTKISDGTKNSKWKMTSAIWDCFNSCLTVLTQEKNVQMYYDAGKTFTEELAKGMLAKNAINTVTAAGGQVALAGYNGLVDYWDDPPPTSLDLVEDAGSFFTEEVANGMTKKEVLDLATSAGADVGIESIKGLASNLTNAISTGTTVGGSFLSGLLDSMGIDINSLLGATGLDETLNKLTSIFDDTGEDSGDDFTSSLANAISSDSGGAYGAAVSLADKIASAFEDRLNNLSINMSIADAEFELWKAMNPNASDYETAQMGILYTSNAVQKQAEKVQALQEKYLQMNDELGEDAEDTQNAYLEYIQANTELLNLRKNLAEYDAQASQSYGSQAQQVMKEIENLYAIRTGYGLDVEQVDAEIEKLRAKLKGTGSNSLVSAANTSASNVLATTTTTIANSASSSLYELGMRFEDAGYDAAYSYTTSAASGISDNTQYVTDSTDNMISVSEELVSDTGYDSGISFDDQLAAGILDNSSVVSDAVSSVVGSAMSNAVSSAQSQNGTISSGTSTGSGTNVYTKTQTGKTLKELQEYSNRIQAISHTYQGNGFSDLKDELLSLGLDIDSIGTTSNSFYEKTGDLLDDAYLAYQTGSRFAERMYSQILEWTGKEYNFKDFSVDFVTLVKLMKEQGENPTTRDVLTTMESTLRDTLGQKAIPSKYSDGDGQAVSRVVSAEDELVSDLKSATETFKGGGINIPVYTARLIEDVSTSFDDAAKSIADSVAKATSSTTVNNTVNQTISSPKNVSASTVYKATKSAVTKFNKNSVVAMIK